MNDELCYLSAADIATGVRRRDFSPVEVVDAFLARIDTNNKHVNAYVTVIAEDARERARAAEKGVLAGRLDGPLHGVPIAIKDLSDHKAGVPNSSGSKPLADFVSPTTSLQVQRLEGAGAIVLGKTNTPEFGARSTTDNYIFGPTSTPFAPGKNAGGSSGGSAAAVGAGLAAMATASDGGGSIRIPASLCGIYGLKPTAGLIPRKARPDAFGFHTPFGDIGPVTRTVDDAALMMEVLTDHEPRDPFSPPGRDLEYRSAVDHSVEGIKVAYSSDLGIFPVEPAVSQIVERAVKALEPLVKIVEAPQFKLDRSNDELSALWWQEIGVANATIAARWKAQGIDLLGKHAEELSPEFRESAEKGSVLSALDYRMGDIARTEVYDRFEDLFETYDVLITPTVGVLPFDNRDDGNTLGPSTVCGQKIDPVLGWILTYPLNFTGHPAASVPAGFTADGLPVGLQIIGRRFSERTILAVSGALERVNPWAWAYKSLIPF